MTLCRCPPACLVTVCVSFLRNFWGVSPTPTRRRVNNPGSVCPVLPYSVPARLAPACPEMSGSSDAHLSRARLSCGVVHACAGVCVRVVWPRACVCVVAWARMSDSSRCVAYRATMCRSVSIPAGMSGHGAICPIWDYTTQHVPTSPKRALRPAPYVRACIHSPPREAPGFAANSKAEPDITGRSSPALYRCLYQALAGCPNRPLHPFPAGLGSA